MKNNLQTPLLNNEWNGKIYINGWVKPGRGTEEILEKATGISIGQTGIASPEDISNAGAVARFAQKGWAKKSGAQRSDVLREFARLIHDYSDEIATYLVKETGSIMLKAKWEVQMASREFSEAAALATQPTGFLTSTLEPGFQSIARRIPMGVIGIITPWNSPIILAARAIAPALAMGNAVVLKPDVQSPVSGGFIFAKLLELANLPEGLFHVLPGGPETGEALVKEPTVDMVSFTGSTRAGKLVGANASGLLKRVALELGGDNPYIVLEDVDIEAAASAGTWGSFFHQGQICLSIGRHLVHESIAEAYTEALVRKAQALIVGNPLDEKVQVGPVINERQVLNVLRILDDSVAQGAKILTGGKRNNLFIEPTVVTNVLPGMPLFDEEIFGPIATITTFKNDEEAIELANMTDYGLVSAVVSSNLVRAQHIADNIRTGVVHINDQTVVHGIYGPIAGVGKSGNGFGHGTVSNADTFSEWQWITTHATIPNYPF